jgi:hypothetical protein
LAVFAAAPGQPYGFSLFIDSSLATTALSHTELSALYALGMVLSAMMTLVFHQASIPTI